MRVARMSALSGGGGESGRGVDLAERHVPGQARVMEGKEGMPKWRQVAGIHYIMDIPRPGGEAETSRSAWRMKRGYKMSGRVWRRWRRGTAVGSGQALRRPSPWFAAAEHCILAGWVENLCLLVFPMPRLWCTYLGKSVSAPRPPVSAHLISDGAGCSACSALLGTGLN